MHHWDELQNFTTSLSSIEYGMCTIHCGHYKKVGNHVNIPLIFKTLTFKQQLLLCYSIFSPLCVLPLACCFIGFPSVQEIWLS